MAYDANPAATHDPTTGVVVPTAWLDLINSNFAEIGAAWTSYTPTWTSSGTAPAIGNGTLTGAYKQLGKLLFFRIKFVAGSTTTFGTGDYRWALPNGLSAVSGVEQTFAGKVLDSSTGNYYVVTGFIATGVLDKVQAVPNNAVLSVGASSPMTWATSDSIHFTGCIEVQ